MEQTPEDWQAFYDRHGPALLLFARKITNSLAEAEDAVHDGFIRFWKRRDQVEDALAYLYRAVRHAALDNKRSSGRRQRREEALQYDNRPAMAAPWQAAAQDEMDKRLRAAIDELPAEQREALVLKVWGGLTFDQIAVATDSPRSTAAARCSAAMKTLRSQLPSEELS